MSGCYCDYERPVFYHASRPVARNHYRCDECGTSIAPGDRYERLWAKWEDVPTTFLTCADCLAVRDAFSVRECFCLLHGGLWESVEDDLRGGRWKPGEKTAALRLIAVHPARRRP
jgi:hypothetical protein